MSSTLVRSPRNALARATTSGCCQSITSVDVRNSSISLRWRKVLRQLDIGPPRVGQKRDGGRRVRKAPVRAIELLPGGFELLAELLEVLHLEPDVIETATFGSSGSGGRLPE